MKMTKEHLDMSILALNYSPFSEKVQLIAMLTKIRDNDKLTTCHENVVIELDKKNDVTPVTGKTLLDGTVKYDDRRYDFARG